MAPGVDQGHERRYRYAGLRVASEISLPEWTPFEDPSPGEAPDVIISLEEFSRLDPGGVENVQVPSAGEYRCFVPGVGAFHVCGGRRITVTPLPEATGYHLRSWLIGSVWAALCYQRGMFLLHASSVMVGDEAVLFCARTKGGKSTIAAKLNTRGHALIGDDLCNLEVTGDGSPVVYPSTPRLKLWSDALGEIGWRTEGLEPDHVRNGKFHAKRAGHNQPQRAPVRAVYLLEWGEFAIRRLSGLTALRHFLGVATYRPKLMESMEHLAKHTNCSLALLQSVPVWELRRPRDLAALARSADLLMKHWLSV